MCGGRSKKEPENIVMGNMSEKMCFKKVLFPIYLRLPSKLGRKLESNLKMYLFSKRIHPFCMYMTHERNERCRRCERPSQHPISKKVGRKKNRGQRDKFSPSKISSDFSIRKSVSDRSLNWGFQQWRVVDPPITRAVKCPSGSRQNIIPIPSPVHLQ